jgi:hypothetical protein
MARLIGSGNSGLRRIVAAKAMENNETMASSYTANANNAVYGYKHPPLPLPRDREYDDGYYLADFCRCAYCGHLAYIHRCATDRCMNTRCDCRHLTLP